MEQKRNRTIKEVLNYETGECVDADSFFSKPLDEIILYRSHLQKAIENFSKPLFGCYYCKQKVRIRGGSSGSGVFHFAHLKDSIDCPIKTKTKYTKEEFDRIKYNGAKESSLHIKLKEQIAECLRVNEVIKKEISDVNVEKVIKNTFNKEWKKPDINALFNSKRIAIELQLSTTWLDVITRRQHFYEQQGIYIFWIFHHFNEEDDLRRLTFNDVIYTNNQNAYIFNDETYELSKSQNDLVLKCFYKTYKRENLKLIERWENAMIKLSDLTFDKSNFKIFYHDAAKQKRILQQEIKDITAKNLENNRLNELREQEYEQERWEKERKQKELNRKINKLNDEIKQFTVAKSSIGQEEQESDIKFKNLNDFLFNSLEYSDKTSSYFIDSDKFHKPFYHYEDLLEKLKNLFLNEVKLVSQTIKQNKDQYLTTTNKLKAINNLESVEILGKCYLSLSNKSNWDFIKQNHIEITAIAKDKISDMFVSEYLKSFKHDYDLNPYQYSESIYFLMDFSHKVKDLIANQEALQHNLIESSTTLDKIQKRIKHEIEAYLKAELAEVSLKLTDYSERRLALNKEIALKQIELNKLQKSNQNL